jgi:acetyl esterase/lipase
VTSSRGPGEASPGLPFRPLPTPRINGSAASYRELIYASPIGYRPLSLDLHMPIEAAGRPPLVIFIHGGAFRMGHRTELPPVLQAIDPFQLLPAAGVAIATIDYRLSGEALWPACVLDTMAALVWLRSRADELGFDPQRIVIWGESAGAYLALMTGYAEKGVTDEGPGGLMASAPPGVRAVVSWYAPVDFTTMQDQGAVGTLDAGSPESDLLGRPVREVLELAREASPLRYLRRGGPKLLIMHGDEDVLVPFGQAIQLADAAMEAGIDTMLRPVRGAGHVFAGSDDWNGIADQILAFLLATFGS